MLVPEELSSQVEQMDLNKKGNVDPSCRNWDPRSLSYPDVNRLYEAPLVEVALVEKEITGWIVHHRIYRLLKKFCGCDDGFEAIATTLHNPDDSYRSYDVLRIRDNLIHEIYGSTQRFMEQFLKAYGRLKPCGSIRRDYTFGELKMVLEDEYEYDDLLNFLAGLELFDNQYAYNCPDLIESMLGEWRREDDYYSLGGTCSLCGGGSSRYGYYGNDYYEDDDEGEQVEPERWDEYQNDPILN